MTSESSPVSTAPIANVITRGQRFSNARAGAMTFAPTLIVIDERMTMMPPISTTGGRKRQQQIDRIPERFSVERDRYRRHRDADEREERHRRAA